MNIRPQIGNRKSAIENRRVPSSRAPESRVPALLLLLTAFCLLPTPLRAQVKTTVTDQAYYDPSGNLAAGRVTFRPGCEFQAADGSWVSPTDAYTFQINGQINVQLIPNATCQFSTTESYYVAQFSVSSSSGGSNWTEYWRVPASGPVGVGAVALSAPPPINFTFPMTQVAPMPGWSSGTPVPSWNGTAWVWSAGGSSPGLADPGANGIVVRTALNATRVATYLDITSLFSGSTPCYLKSDGTCSTPSSMVWPSGSAGIPNYNGGQGWGATYNASNVIPLNFLTMPATTNLIDYGSASPSGLFGSANSKTTVAGQACALAGSCSIASSNTSDYGGWSLAAFGSQSQNCFFAGPSGSAGIPTCRPMVVGDLPLGVGTSANNLVQLNSSGFLPALNGSLLTNLTYGHLVGAPSALPPNGSAGGDLCSASSYPSPNVCGLNGVNLAGLATGLLKNTTVTGAPSIAVPGVDYITPSGLLGGTAFYGSAYGVLANGIALIDGVWSNGSPNVSSASASFACPGSSYPCSSGGDVGKTFWGVINTGFQSGSSAQATGNPQISGTITTVTDAHHIVISANATATSSSGGNFVYGSLDDTGISAMDTAMQASKSCPVGVLPAGIMMVTTAHFITNPTACTNNGVSSYEFGTNGYAMVLGGQGKGISVIAPTPGFNFSTCTGGASVIACFGGQKGAYFHDFSINGFGNSLNGTNVGNHNGFEGAVYGLASNMMWASWGASATNFSGLVAGAGDSNFTMINSTVDAFGVNQCTATAGLHMISSSCQDAAHGVELSIPNTSAYAILDTNSYLLPGVGTASGESVVSLAGGQFIGAEGGISPNGATVSLYGFRSFAAGSQVWLNDFGINLNTSGSTLVNLCGSGGSLHAINSTFTPYSSGGVAIYMQSSCANSFFNGGGNTWGAGTTIVPGATGNIQGQDVSTGFCTGTATSSATLYLWNFGASSASTCTATTALGGYTVPRPGTIGFVVASAGTAGVSATLSGVLTVYKNGSATSMTCTLGIGTACQDYTHTFSVIVGDLVTVQFTATSGETLANVKAQLYLE